MAHPGFPWVAVQSYDSGFQSAKQRDPLADTTALEQEIDPLVYALYGLTPEEIAIMEGGTR